MVKKWFYCCIRHVTPTPQNQIYCIYSDMELIFERKTHVASFLMSANEFYWNMDEKSTLWNIHACLICHTVLSVVPTPTVRKTVQAKLQQQQQPRLDLNQGKIVATQTPTYANAAPPSEVYDPLYSNQPVQPRQHKDILGLDWLSLMYNPRSSLADQLHQVSSS